MDKFLDPKAESLLLIHMANNLDHIFHALSDPTRRAVVEQLAGGPSSVSDLFEPYDMALPTFMKHIAKLETAGLVRSAKKGRVRTVHIEAAALARLDAWVEQHRALWSNRLDRLAQIAENTPQK